MTQKDVMENYQIVMVKILVGGNEHIVGERLTELAEGLGNKYNFGYQSRKPTREEAKEALEQMSDQ